VNFTYVRSLISLILASLVVGLALAPPPTAVAQGETQVTVALLPKGTGLAGVGSLEGFSPGLMSAGIGSVPAAQTYLDITQGNRVSESLYDEELPALSFDAAGVERDDWEAISDRAEAAPAEVAPGLLASTLADAGVSVRAEHSAGLGRLIAADRDGKVDEGRGLDCPGPGCQGLVVEELTIAELERRASALEGDDMVIAFERPPPLFRTLAIGIAGAGSDGLLTSDSTRTEGLVTSTDVAPTVLDRLGVPRPDEMNGEPIRAEGDRDVAGLIDLSERLEVTGGRRGPVVGGTLLIWLAVAGMAVALRRRRAAEVVVPILALSLAWLPFVLLITPAFDPSQPTERIAAVVGAPLLALLAWRLAGGWRALALAALLTVAAYAIDVVAGSILVPLSIPGPNPVSGSRFYGIGNEIEAIVAALLPIGVGAALATGPRTRDGGTAAAATFLGAGLVAAAAFALGRFGADVGAAIVLPAGAAVAAAVALGTRRGVVVALLVPVAGLVALMTADLVFGGEAHLTRSLLEAGGLDEAGDVLERRVRLAADSFTKPASLPFLAFALIAIAIGVRRREVVRSWFVERSAWAGFLGAAVAAVVGTVSNDSGVVLLILGSAYCLATAGFAWSIRQRP
jgi:hypothetical protein